MLFSDYQPPSYDELIDDDGTPREAAAALTAEGTQVRFLRSIYLPEDETCFFLYRASSMEAVHAAARRAQLAYEHVAVTARTRPHSQRIGGSR